MYEERFAELLGYLQTYLKNGRPDLINSPEFAPEKWLAEWCETKNPRLGSGHDRPSDLWDVQDGFDEVDNRLREAVDLTLTTRDSSALVTAGSSQHDELD